VARDQISDANSAHGLGLRERQAWARRQGNPAWLWPEVSPADWSNANAQIAGVIPCGLGLAEPATLTGDPIALGLAGFISGMGPLLGCWLESGAILASDPQVAAIYAAHLGQNRQRTSALLERAGQLLCALAEAGVSACLLKGAHTAQTYFSEAGARPMSDIDILVARKDAAMAERVLRAQGYVCEDTAARESTWRHGDSSRELASMLMVSARDPWTVDLHWSLDLAVSEAAPLARLDPAEWSEMTAPRQQGRAGSVLRQPLLLLHLAVHAGGALHNLSLLRLVELCLVIRRDTAAGGLDWREFLDLAARTGSSGYAYPALELCERLAPGCLPRFVLDALASSAPPKVIDLISGLTPAQAQRVGRYSFKEHVMWTRGWRAWLRQIAADLLPGKGGSLGDSARIYARRARILLRGGLTR